MKKINKHDLKNENGISMVVLIVTIIIMLILAVVVVRMSMSEDGVISNADKATTKNRVVEIQSAIDIWKAEKAVAEYSATNVRTTAQFLDELLAQKLINEKEYEELKRNGYIMIDEVIISIEDDTKTINVANQDELLQALTYDHIETIKVNGTILITETINIAKNVRFVGASNDACIKRESTFTGDLFSITDSEASVVINKLKFDGAAPSWSFDTTLADEKIATSISAPASSVIQIPDTDVQSKGVLIRTKGNLVISNCVLQNNLNYSSAKAGITIEGVSIDDTKVEIIDTTIKHCAAYNGNGAAVYVTNATAVLDNCTITNNYGYGNGAIVCAHTNVVLDMNGGSMTYNNYYGNGTVMAYKTDFTINGGSISNNRGYSKSGGTWGCTLYAHTSSTITLNGGNISNNLTNKGAIVCNNAAAKVHLNKGIISNNSSYAGYASKDDQVVSATTAEVVIEKDVTINGTLAFFMNTINRGTINGNAICPFDDAGYKLTNEGTINGYIKAGASCIVQNTGIVTGGIIQE